MVTYGPSATDGDTEVEGWMVMGRRRVKQEGIESRETHLKDQGSNMIGATELQDE